MIKLINIELKKIFRHKSIYAVFILIFIFCFFNNLLYNLDYNDDGRYKYDDNNISHEIVKLKKELDKYNYNNNDDKNMFVTTKSKLDVYNNMIRYDKNSWQYIRYNDYMYDTIYYINYYTYIDKNNDKLKEYNNKLAKYNSIFDNNNYMFFLKQEKDDLNSKINNLKEELKNITDKELYNNIDDELGKLNISLLIIDYRINKNIDYGNNYLNRALINYHDGIIEKNKFNNYNLSYNNKIKYRDIIKNIYENKYIIDNGINIYKENTINNQLKDICLDYELFIIIIILIVSGILLGEEFSKGTIKLLLIKPYNRYNILLCKLLTGIIVIFISILFLICCELLLGGIFLDFNSLKIPMIIYNFNSNSIVNYNIFEYMLIKIFVRLPKYIFILMLSMFLNIIFINNIFGFAITMIFYSISIVVNNLIINNNIKIFKYFITLNWDFSDYLFGGLGNYRYLSLKSSIFIYVIYVIIILAIMFVKFNRKDIKNI